VQLELLFIVGRSFRRQVASRKREGMRKAACTAQLRQQSGLDISLRERSADYHRTVVSDMGSVTSARVSHTYHSGQLTSPHPETDDRIAYDELGVDGDGG